MSGLPSKPCASFMRLNPKYYAGAALQPKAQSPVPDALSLRQGDRTSSKRVRQDAKPLLNKLETAWLAVLKISHPDVTIHAQEWRVKLANGAWFKVDFCAFIDGVWKAWECKGPKQGKNVSKGLLALKFAAAKFPEVKWILVWKDADGLWRDQIILP